MPLSTVELLGKDEERPSVHRFFWIFLVAYVVVAWVLPKEGPDLTHLHGLFDGGILLLAAVLGLLMLDIGGRTAKSLYRMTAYCFLGRAVIELFHASISVGGTALSSKANPFLSGVVRYTDVIILLVLPSGLLLAWRFFDFKPKAQRFFLPVFAGFVLLVIGSLGFFPSFSFHGGPEIGQPLLPVVMLLWITLAIVFWKRQSTERFAQSMFLMTFFFLIANTLAFFTVSAADQISVAAHAGEFAGLLFMLSALMRFGAMDIERRIKIERNLRESEERYRAVAETATDGILTVTERGIILYANSAAAKIFGRSSEELNRRSVASIVPGLLAYFQRKGGEPVPGERRGPASASLRVELTGLLQSGAEIPLEISIGEFHRQGEEAFTAIIRDITERKRIERNKAAQYELTRVLTDAESLETAAPDLLRILCTSADYHCGFLWRVDEAEQQLRCSGVWAGPDQQADGFTSLSRVIRFRKGEGFPGRIWEEEKLFWIEDVTAADNCPRREAALASHLHGGFGLPISINATVIGVIEMLSTRPRLPDNEMLEMTVSLGNQIGQFDERRRIEQERKNAYIVEQRARERVALLADATTELVSSLDYYDRLGKLAELCVSSFVDVCIVDMLGEDELITRVAIAHRVPAKAALAAEINSLYPDDPTAPWGVYHVLRTGEAAIQSEVTDDGLRKIARDAHHFAMLKLLGLRSIMILPLTARGKTFGALTFGCDDPGRSLTGEEISLAGDIAARAALAVDNARLFLSSQATLRELQRKNIAFERLNTDLERRVQERTEELSRYIKELESFSYTVAHDLRSPLRAINGFAHALIEDHAALLGPNGEKYLGNIARSAKEMGQLIDDLLSFSRVSRRGMVAVAINMKDLAASVLHELLAREPDRKIEITMGDLPVVRGDRAMIRQALFNILENSLKFSRRTSGAAITIGVIQREGELIFFVKDNGVGFENKYAQKIFGVFQRLHAREEYEGTGIGLSISQRVIQRHGGRIWAEGEEQKGATIFFTLPSILSDDRTTRAEVESPQMHTITPRS